MISTTFHGQTVWLMTAPPNWQRPVELELEIPVEREVGLTRRELRRPAGASLRCRMIWSATLAMPAMNALRDGLRQVGDAPVIVPAWPFVNAGGEFDSGAHTGGGIWIGWNEGWSAITVADAGGFLPGFFDRWAPGLYGRLELEVASMQRPDLAEVRFTFTEDGLAPYALSAPGRTWTNGPALNDGTIPKVFPAAVNWAETIGVGFPRVEVEDRRMGPGRRSAREYYPQNAYRGLHGASNLTSREAIASLLRWWIDAAASTAPHYVAMEAQTAELAADAPAGAGTLTVVDGSTIGAYRYMALRSPGAIGIVRVSSVVGNGLVLASNLTALWPRAATTISPAALCRHAEDILRVQFAGPELARAELSWQEVTEEYILALGEVRGTSIGPANVTAWLYELVLDVHGSETVYRFTSYEQDLEADSSSWVSHPIEHSELRASLDLTTDEVTIKTRTLPVLEQFLPGRLTGRVLLRISECSVSGSAGTAVTHRWAGEIVSASFEGPFVQATARGQYALFDIPFPRWVIQPQCNHTVYDAGCGLSRTDWTFTAAFVSGTGHTVTLDTVARSAGLPTGWGFANYFALGYLERASGERLPILASSALAGGEITLTLDRVPAEGWAVDEPVSVIPGCDGRKESCQGYGLTLNPEGKFDNYARFLGTPFVPAKNPAFTPPKRTDASSGKK